MDPLTAVPGTNDILPPESARWDELRSRIEGLMARYAYGRIETPHFEEVDLFSRSVGQTSDIVEKEMYRFEDQGGRRLALRPEGTAGVVRAFIEAQLARQRPFYKLWYWGPMFRAERPQKGRYRQFWQFGVEAFGAQGPRIDAEQIVLARLCADAAGVDPVQVRINSIGDGVCRPRYREQLTAFFARVQPRLCSDCRRRLSTNPLRILDCKEAGCREATRDAPWSFEQLCEPCAEHFAGVRRFLDQAGLAYAVDGRIVRGLDYYQRTAFEITSPKLGAQDAVLGGGRYDGLVEQLGGGAVPGVGWAAGIERMILAGAEPAGGMGALDVYVAGFEATAEAGFGVAEELRRAGLRVEVDFLGRSIKAQLKEAARSGARFAVVVGPDEWAHGCVVLRDLEAGTQAEVGVGDLASRLSALRPDPGRATGTA